MSKLKSYCFHNSTLEKETEILNDQHIQV